MATYVIKSENEIYRLSAQGIRKFMRENPNKVIMSKPMDEMPHKLHNEIAAHNAKANPNLSGEKP